MGRTNYSLNEMLNSVTKRAFNRYTSQTVDYQHLEAATTTTGLVSNRREYSSASILADTFSLNAQNIVESNYDPFLKVNVNSVITSRAVDIPQVGHLSSCTDDGRFLALAHRNDDEVKVYEFNNSLVDKTQLSSLGTINTNEMMDVDMNGDGSETFVAKKVGTTQVVVDNFDQDLNSVSSTTLLTTSLALIGASIGVSENGVRVAVTATSNHLYNSLPYRHLFLQVHDNLNTNEYYRLYSDYEVLAHPLALMSRNGRIVVVNIGGSVITFEIPSSSPSGVVSLSPVHTQIMGIDKFDLSYDGKVMLTHAGSDAQIYTWNGIEWKQFGQTISTGLSGNIVSVAISEYARYFVVASSDQIKVYKLNSVYEQYGTIINGDFGSSGHKICISKTGDTVFVGNSQIASSYGRAYVYNLINETNWSLVDQIDGSVDTNTSYVLDYVNFYNPYYDGNHGIRYLHNGGHWTNNNGLLFQTNAPFIRLTDNTEWFTNSGIRIPVTFGSSWSVTFKWHVDNNHVSDGSSMSFIFFAPNAPTSTSESQHGGYRVLHNFQGGSETHEIKNPSGNSVTNNSVSYGHSGSAGQAFPPWGASEYKTVTVSYDNGVLFTRVTNTPDSFLNNGYYTTFTGSDLEAQRALWGTQTYIAFGGNTGGWYGDNTGDGATAGYTSFQYIKDFFITQQSTPDNLGKYVRLSNSGDKILIGLQNQLLFKTSSLVKIEAGWEQKGGTITSIDTLSLSLSNDGNYLVIGVSDSVKIFNFSQGSWSQYREIIANDLQFMDFGKYVSITMSGSKVAVGSDKNSIVRVYEPHNVDTTVIEPVKNVVDTISLTPQTSLLEMSGDGNRLFLNADTTVSSTILQSLTIVSTPSGNKYSLDGVTQPTLYLKKGVTFTGIASTFREGGSHPLRISATPDGTHGGDSTVIAEVNTSGNLLIPTSAPNMLYYFCGQHPNMGGVVKIIQGLSIWDKNNAGVWGVRDGLTEGDVIQLSNNGDYLSVNYSNIARLYGIDSDGVVSKIGNDIAATTVTSGAGVFRTFTPTHINTGVSDSGSLILASYQDASRAVEICSLTWDPTLSTQLSLSTQSSEITGFSTLSQAKYGIVLSRNGQTLVVYDDLKFSVYTYDGTQWTFIRTKITVTCHDVAISYDGTLLAYKGDKETDLHGVFTTHLFIESAVSGSSNVESSIAEIDVDPTTFAFKSNTTLAVCIPNQDIQLYVHPSWVLSNEITPGYSSPFIEAHAKWSGDGTRLAVGDANAERVSFYEYDNSLVSVTSFSQSGSTISGPTEQVVSGNGNVRVVGHPQYNSYTGYVEIYEKDGNGDWPSTANATFNGPSPTENFGSSIGISETGTRVVIGSGSNMIVVEKSGGTWSQLGSDISGSATKVAISGDGTKVFNSHGTNLHSYELSSGSWVTYLPTLTTDGSIVRVDSSSSGDGISLSKNNSNKVYGVVPSGQLGADIDGEANGDFSGTSVSLSADGTRVAIGAKLNGNHRGHVRVYDWNSVTTQWEQIGADIDGEANGDFSGISVSLSADGSRVAIGAELNDGGGAYSGHVRVYELSGSSWTQVGADIDGEAQNDRSGYSVSLSANGSRVAIGAYQNGGTAATHNSGHVRVYELSGSSWTQVGADIDGEVSFDSSGRSVSLSADGSRVSIGAPLNDGNGNMSGHVRVYDYIGASWTQVGADIDGEAPGDYSGYSVSLSADGSRVAIGAYKNDNSSGHVRVYDYIGASWTQVGADIDGEAPGDYSGYSVSLSADGSRVAIGAYKNDNSSGHVRVYDYIGASWTQVGADIDGEAPGDYSGYSVSLSADGSMVAIGAYYNDGNGNNSGHVRVFAVSGIYSLQSTNSGPMIDISNDGNTTLTVNSGMGTFNLAALSGDATKAVVWDAVKLKQYHYTSGAWIKTYELDINYTPTTLSINTDGSIVGVASSSDVRFYVFGPVQVANGWTLHSFIAGGGNTLENFGSVVDLSNDGNTVLVGAPGDGTSSYKGYVKVYDYVSSAWTLRHTITASAESDVNFGKSVSLSSDGNRIGYVFDQETTTTYSQASIRDSVDGTLINPVDSNSDLVNFSEGRELSGISMSYDGTQYGIRATSGSYDAVVKVSQPIVNGWTKRGGIMSFSFPNDPSFASNSKRDMSVSSDGNTIAFGWILSQIRVRVYGFSNGAWSTLNRSGGYDIYPGGSGNPIAISVDLSSDGMTLATLSSYLDHAAEAKTYSYSSSGWVQIGSTINFVETGSNTIKISGDGTTLALGLQPTISGINSIRVYRMGSTDWEIVSPPMHLSAMNPSNFFGAGLNLTNDGSTLTTFNNSGVEFSNFTTQSVVRPSQYLNDITVSGATIDMGGIRFSDSGDSLFIMSGDRRVRVYDSNHNIEIDHGWAGLDTFSSTKDGNSMVLCGEYGYTKVFNRSNGTWSLLLGTPFNTNVTDPVVDIKSGGSTLVFVAPGHDLRVYGYENGSWSQVTTSSGTRGTSVAITDTDMIVVDNKTFQIEDQFQDNSFSAPTLSLNGDSYIRLDFGSPYIERGATITTTASITPGVVISGEVFNEEPGIYTIKYEAEDLLRKKAVPIFRTVEVLPKLPIIKLNGDRVIHHTLGTQLIDPGVTTSIPVNVYHRFANQTTVVAGFPNFLTETTVGEYKIFYTNDTVDKYLRTSSMVSRTIHLRARPVLNLVGGSTVYNPLGETYIDPGVTVSGDAVVSFKKPNVNLSQIQTIKYTAKDEFGIEAVPITRQVIVSERPTITTSGTLFRILNDPISIPTPTVKPVELTSSLNSSNNININQSGTYTITYNVSDSNNIPANQERQSYEVGSYGELSVTKTGYLSNLSKNGRNLAVFNTDIQTYGKELDGSWSNNGFITTPNGSVVTSMKFTSNGSHLVFGMASHLTIGLVRVYKRNTSFVNGWEQVGLDLFGVDYQGKFGHAVDINNDATRIIVSAPEANTNSGTILKAGSLKIYDLQENFWIQQTQIIEGLGAFELLGTSISMSTDGNIIAIGSPGHANTTVSENSVTSVNVGKTTVYSYTDNAWGRVGNVIEDGTIEKRNGFSISLSNDGTTIAIGSENGGGVRVYRFVSNSWIPFGSHISGTFGKSVALTGNTVVIGSEAENNGRVYIYTYGGDDWSLLGDTFEKVIVAEGGTNDMGKFVTISDDRTLLSVVSQSDIRVYSI